MKIAITSTGNELNSDMDPRFGRAQYYIIYDIDHDEIMEIINNNDNMNASGGAGTSAAQIIAAKGAEAVISGNFGPNATKGLTGFGIKMFQSEVKKIDMVIADYKAKKLNIVSNATVAGHH
ncbi:MAG: NifB/NifX family molybdenum-iron cluster-binding protein [Candidatus Margulisbacteria bacterium]|nr:NifB/NifX family molybdenum-iron cluster-binding protein [Candidatus Margulisiibacteriota bacterium]